MQIESETTVAKPPAEVFEYIAHAEFLPEYVTDFDTVRQVSDGDPGLGTQYSYKMGRGAEGTFEWTEFSAPSRLAWHGPKVSTGPGSMEPAGSWDISEQGGATRVKLVMAPRPGGLFKLLAPFMSAAMRKGNDQALERLKRRLEQAST